jgi:hypothetical protein
MAIDIDGAEAYFAIGKHSAADTWQRYPNSRREGAVAESKRVLSRTLGRPMREDEEPYKAGDKTRDEYAVYEHALYLLEGAETASPYSGSAVNIFRSARSEADQFQSGKRQYIAPEALRWLGYSGTVVVRG